MIGKRLRLARAAAGLSLRDLQAKIGNRVSAQQIGKYERDEDVPGSCVLIALSDALGVSLDYLAGDQEMVLDGIEFRKKQITRKKEEAQVQAKALHLIERYLMVEQILGLASALNGAWVFRSAPYPVRELADAEMAAKNLHDHWKLGIDPIPNLVELLEERGIKVLLVESENIDGMADSRSATQANPCARKRRNRYPQRRGMRERQRFNLAHELGHIVMDVQGDEQFREKAAHRFAGAFLMPAEALWSNVGRHRTSIGWSELFALKQLFGASIQAITYRCGDLGIFPQSLSRRDFSRSFPRRGFPKCPQLRTPPLGPRNAGAFRPSLLPGARRRRDFRAEDRRTSEYFGARAESAHGGTSSHWRSMILVSDTSVLIDLERASFLEVIFALPHEFAVPDVLYHREMQGDWGERLVQLGLRVEELSEQGVSNALRYRSERRTLSVPDTFALALAKEREWLLLTGDGQLRELAAGENVECHGVLWLLDLMEEAGIPGVQLLHDGLEALARHERCRLPRREITIRLERYRATMGR